MEISTAYHASDEIRNFSDDLVARAQSGDREAMGQIFKTHHRFIFKFIYAMHGNHSLAEEMTQETFHGAYNGLSSLRGEVKLQTWLCGIAKNIVYQA
ncbi:hypothetical protein BH10ACI2_BH10ACI2_06630 [soil metagenome]